MKLAFKRTSFAKHPDDARLRLSTSLRVYDQVVAALSFPRVIESVWDVGLEVDGVALLQHVILTAE